jgi:hemerythrin-like domain-containing protein
MNERYVEQDVRDLLFYVASWVKTVEHHHDTEESCLFPEIEAVAGKPGLFDGPKEQHTQFTKGLEELLHYAESTKAGDYRWIEMKRIIDAFADSMTAHLYEEIDVILSLGDIDSEQLRHCWEKAEQVAKATGKLSMLVRRYPQNDRTPC